MTNTGWRLVIGCGAVFGAKKLPEMARSVGRAARVLNGEMKTMCTDDAGSGQASVPGPPAHTVGQPLDVTQQAEPTHVRLAPITPRACATSSGDVLGRRSARWPGGHPGLTGACPWREL
jgi:Sec-independent protein translocase protein TatA